MSQARRAAAQIKRSHDVTDSVHGQLACGYVVPYVASTTDIENIIGSCCDGVQVPLDDHMIAFEGADAADTALDAAVGATPTSVGAGWTDNGNGTYTHAAAGGTAALTWTLVLTVGSYVLSKYTVATQTAGTVTAGAGATAGAATAANAAVREALQVTTTQTYSLTPDTNFDGTISLVEVLPFSGLLKAGYMTPMRCRRIEMLIDSAGAEVDEAMHLGWYRKP